AQVVATLQLLAFPWAQRLERVNRDHQRESVTALDENASQVAVPRVAVHDVGVRGGGRPGNVARHGTEHRLERRAPGHPLRFRIAAYVQPALVDALIAKAADLDVHQLRELSTQELHVHARTTVDVRRVFIGQ